MIAKTLLFTPGPLTTSSSVKEAMLVDLGSRDSEFLAVVHGIREKLLELAACPRCQYECVPLQGSGTYAIESVVSSVIPRDGKLLVLVNGAYGRRIAQIARIHAIPVEVAEVAEDRKITPDLVAERLESGSGITHVAVVHCETTTGILNPIEEIGGPVSAAGAAYIVDAMSSFGALPLDAPAGHVDFLISSANKCIEGVPGFGFVLARRSALGAAKETARTLSLNLYAQWAGLEGNGQFRFTPPTHVLLAFAQALKELDQEGGVAARGERYRQNQVILSRGMRELGFETYLAGADQSCIITTFRYPADPAFQFEKFYARLSELGFVIYPGKLTMEPCFRIGSIGRIYGADMTRLVGAIQSVLSEMGVRMKSGPRTIPRT
jgi:2-aminoethylphosphonate-pyruvate transaminase